MLCNEYHTTWYWVKKCSAFYEIFQFFVKLSYEIYIKLKWLVIRIIFSIFFTNWVAWIISVFGESSKPSLSVLADTWNKFLNSTIVWYHLMQIIFWSIGYFNGFIAGGINTTKNTLNLKLVLAGLFLLVNSFILNVLWRNYTHNKNNDIEKILLYKKVFTL